MFVVSERNIIIPGPDGQKFHMSRKYMGTVPGWVEGSPYFKALVKDKKVIISASGKDKDIDAALQGKKQRGKKASEPAAPGNDLKGHAGDIPDLKEGPEKEGGDPNAGS